MKLPWPQTPLWRSATLLLMGILLLACSLLPGSPKNTATTAPDHAIAAGTRISGRVTATDAPTIQVEAITPPPTETATAGPYTLVVSDRYPFFAAKATIAQSLAARDGQLWIGTVSGTLERFDPRTETFAQSISLAPESGGSEGMPMAYPVYKMAFDGDYLWANAGFFEGPMSAPKLFALHPESGEIIHVWDMNSPEWMQDYERGGEAADSGFGVSPGKIWIDGHIVNTQTFEVMKVSVPTIMTLYAYNGKEWMWITGELGGACDDLILINTNDPTTEWCEDEWPFLSKEADGMGNPMLLAGDKIWMAGSWGASDGSPYVLEAYPADPEQGTQTKGPLLSVSSPDDASAIKLFYAGDYLWVLDTLGNKMGWLFQLDPQTGKLVNSLDLIGDQSRALGDLPVDIATEGDNLWVLTTRQLLRIPLP